MRGHAVRLFTALHAALLLPLLACAPANAGSSAALESHSLAGPWAFQPGDDLAWAAPGFDDRNWPRLHVPGSWRRQGYGQLTGLAWYRLRVPSMLPREELLGVTLGKIDSAYELYVGGRRIGGVGALPPTPRMEYDRHRTYAIPPEIRETDGSVILALRVWRNPRKISTAAGPVEGPFEIGSLARLIENNKVTDAQELAVLLVFLLVALYHLALHYRLGSGDDYFWFGVLALLAALYGVLRSQWKYLVLDDFLALKKIEHTVIWLLPPVILQFLWVFFSQPRPRWLRVTQGLFVAGAVTVAVTPGLIVALAILQGLQLSVIPLLVASVVLTARRVAAGDREARLVGLGMIVLAVTIVHDALVDRNFIVDPRIAIYGFAFLVAGMSVTLGNRFQRALRERDALLRDLEARVDARTHALSEAYRDMRDLALYDGLTHVMNRRAIHDRAESEVARSRRHQLPLTIALLDIDHFKAVNDTYGHAAGDQVLVQVSARLTKAVRASDAVGRWGGEEFLVLMTGTDRHEAAAAGERLRTLIAALPMSIAENVVQTVTVSVGLITVDGIGSASPDLDTLIHCADEAMYRAKAEGRNTVRIADLPLAEQPH